MKVIYVAGKYLGKSNWETYLNIHKARVAAEKLWNDGWAVICPHSNTAFFDGSGVEDKNNPNGNWAMWLNGDLEILARCDAIYVLDNWEESKGATMELYEARRLGLQVIFQVKGIV
jgi:hypothetical protein